VAQIVLNYYKKASWQQLKNLLEKNQLQKNHHEFKSFEGQQYAGMK